MPNTHRAQHVEKRVQRHAESKTGSATRPWPPEPASTTTASGAWHLQKCNFRLARWTPCYSIGVFGTLISRARDMKALGCKA
jgi:hypothetical protein